MATIDDKVVAMSFESSKFESGVSRTIDAIDRLKKALNFQHQSTSLHGVATAAKGVDLGHIGKTAEDVKAHLGALNVAAVAIFANIASKAVTSGTALLKAFTIDPAKTGFQEYSTQLNSVQTILANTQAAGSTLKDVNKALDELNTYSDKTIYNFGQMARNIGTFTAAGVDLKTATASIKGIANLAALSGSNAEQAATAMYQLSQAISSGSVKLMDWNSVVNAGMGGTVFQRALALTGEHMGQLKKGTVELVGPMKNVKIAGESFRNSLSAPGKDGWLTSDVLTKTLKMFTSDMTDAELAADGWNKKEIKAIQAQAKAAMLAATNVKTLQQVLAVAKETAGSGWAKTWRIIFGDFEQAKKTFTQLSNAVNGMLIDSARARNNVLGDWKALGGRKVLIEGIKIAFENLSLVLKPIKAAFRNIFPAKTGQDLYDLTVRFKEFAETLKPSPETIRNLHRTFRGLFAVLDIGKEIIFGVFTALRKMFGTVGEGSGSFLEFTASVGDALTKFHKWLIEGGRLNKVFSNLGQVLSLPIKALQFLAGLFAKVFSGGASKSVDGITKSLTPLEAAFSRLGDAISKVFNEVKRLAGIFEPVLQAWVDLLAQIPALLGKALSTMSFEPILAVIRTGLLGGIFLMFKRFLGKGAGVDQLTKGLIGGFTGQLQGMAKNVNATLAALTNSLVALQQNLKAKTLKEIAIAVALLAASMVVLSFIDPKKLDTAISAITVAFAELLAAMSILGNITKSLGFIKMPIIASTLILLAGAIFVLSASVMLLSLLSWEQLAKGLGAVAILLGVISVAVIPLSASSFGMMKAGIGLMAIAVALNILALAVLAFGKMDLMTLGKGMASIGVALFIIATYIKLMPSGVSMVAQGAGLIAIAFALNLLAVAVLALGSMNLMTLGKGMGAIGISLAIIAGAMQLMPKTMALQAAGLMLVAAALIGIATAVQIMGAQSLTNLAKGLGGLAYSLALLAGMLNLMSGAIPGALALGIAAASIAVLVPALVLLGHQNIKVIAVGLIALAVAFGIIAAAGILLDAAAPGLLAFGAAVALVGAGLALAGAGIFLATAGIAALISAVVLAAGVIPQAFVNLQKSLVQNAKLLVLGLLEIVQAFADTAPQFVDAIVEILKSLIVAVMELVPMVEKLTTILIETLIRVLDQQQGPIIAAIINLVIAILEGIKNNIRRVADLVVLIVAELVRGLAKNIDKIVTAGAQLLTALLRGIANAYSGITKAAMSIITKFLGAIGDNIGKIVTAGGDIIVKFLNGIARNIKNVTTAGANVIVAFVTGIGNAGERIIRAATNAIIKLMNALVTASTRLADAGFKAMINFLNGLSKAIEDNDDELRAAGVRLGKAIVNGLIGGLTAMLPDLKNKIEGMAGDAVGWFKKKIKNGPPSQVFKEIGETISRSLALGMSDTKSVNAAATAMGTGVITAVKDTFQIRSPSQVMYDLGREVTEGFSQGIRTGSEEEINQAFQALQTRISDSLRSIKSEISAAKARRGELKAGKEDKEETKEIKALTKEIKAQVKEKNDLIRANAALSAGLDGDKAKILAHAKAYTILNDKIAQSKAIIEEFKTQYSELPEIIKESEADEEGKTRVLTGAEQLALYTEKITAQAAATAKYNETLQKLVALGLDDTTYRMLLQEGTSGQEFADALVTGGAEAVGNINKLDTDIDTAASTLGDNAAVNLYTAGEEAAKGLIAGLEAQKADLEKLMKDLADTMVRAIKKKLRIKSPSEIFAKIGELSMEGLAKGFKDNSQNVSDAVDAAGQEALTAMQQSIQDISNAVTGELDVNPTITPILDLTQVKSKAAELAALTAAGSYGQATSISAAQTAAQADLEAKTAAMGASVKFEQNNYSPEALTNIEIYRQTKNQLSQLKSSLALT